MPTDTSHFREWLAAAELHYSHYRWDQAIACYSDVLREAPLHAGAWAGMQRAKAQQRFEVQILTWIDEARAAQADGDDNHALVKLDQAQTLCAEKTILAPIAEIDRLRASIHEQQRWQRRAAADVAAARKQMQAQQPELALDILDTLLQDLTAANLAGLGEAARQERIRIWQEIEFEERVRRAHKAFDEQDYRLACQLATELKDTGTLRRQFHRLYEEACHRWHDVEIGIAQVREALAGDRLADAAALLQNLRTQAPQNPEWQGLWLETYTRHGQNALTTGRQAMPSREYKTAGAAFASAHGAFAAVLDVFPMHIVAGPAHQEVSALQEMAALMEQASLEYQARRWNAIGPCLASARRKLTEAQEVRDNRYSDLTAALAAFSIEVDSAISDLQRARSLLLEGEIRFQDRRPNQAERCFREGLEHVRDLDDVLQEQLLAGLRRVAKRKDEIRRIQEQAGAAAEDEERLDLLQALHQLWPNAPGMPDVLAETMLKVAQQAAQAGEEGRAAGLFGELLALPGISPEKDQAARDGQANLAAEQNVAAAIERAQALRKAAAELSLPTIEVYQAIVDLIEGADKHALFVIAAAKRRALQDQVAPLLGQSRRERTQVQQALKLVEDAETLRQKGQWQDAVTCLQQAVEVLGEIPAPQLDRQCNAWRRLAQRLTEALEAAERVYRKALDGYHSLNDGNLTVPSLPVWHDQAAKAATILQEARTDDDPLPEGWQPLEQRVADLLERLELVLHVQGLLHSGHIQRALINIETAKPRWPDDVVLAAISRRLHDAFDTQLEVEAEGWLETAQAQIDRGEMGEALESLRQVRERKPSADISAQARRLQRQSEIWQEVTRLDIEGMAKRQGGSLDEALVAFEQALQKAASPEAALPAEARKALNALLGQKGELHKEEVYTESKKWLNEIRDLAVDHPIVQQRLLSLVLSWHDLAFRTAREVYIRSQLALNKLEDAYEEAVKYASAHPSDPRALQLAADAKQKLLSSVHGSAQKRLGYAQEMMGKGNYEGAQKALGDIEREWLGRLEKRFSEVFANDAEIEAVRQEAGDLGSELRRLTEIAKALKEFPAQIREAYIAGDLEKAEQLITQAERLDTKKEATILWQDIDGLKIRVQKAWQEKRYKDIEHGLSQAEAALEFGQTAEAFAPVLASLSSLRASVEQAQVYGEDELLRQRLTQATVRVRERYDELRRVEVASQAAVQALAEDTIASLHPALEALRRVEPVARGSELERIRFDIDRLSIRLEQKQEEEVWQRDAALKRRDQASRWQEIVKAFDIRNLETAGRLLEEGVRLERSDNDLAPYKKAIELARTLHDVVSIQSDPAAAKSILDSLLCEIETCTAAAPLRQEIEKRLDEIRRLRLQQLQVFLEEAGFSVQPADEWGFVCTSDLPFWSDVSPALARLQKRPMFDLDESQDLTRTAAQALGGLADRVVIAVTERFPGAGELYQISALKIQKRLSIAIVPAYEFSRPQTENEWPRLLRERVKLAIGHEDLYDIRTPLPALSEYLSFFGREPVLNVLQRQLAAGQPTVLFGVPKVGKTSLLYRLQEVSPWPVAYATLFGYTGELRRIYPDILRQWRQWIEIHRPTAVLPALLGAPRGPAKPMESDDFRSQAAEMLAILGSLPDRPGLALLLDESTALNEQISRDNGYLEFAGVLQSLVEDTDTKNRFFFLLCGVDPEITRLPYLDPARKRRNPFGGKFKELPLGCLEQEDARNMIISIGQQMGITYETKALELLLDYGGGHPFLTRQLCSLTTKNLSRPVRVEHSQAIHSVREYLNEPHNYMATTLWPNATILRPGDEERLPAYQAEVEILRALALIQPQSIEDLVSSASSRRQQLLRKAAIARLLDNSLIAKSESGGYQMTIPLYRMWIRLNKLHLSE